MILDPDTRTRLLRAAGYAAVRLILAACALAGVGMVWYGILGHRWEGIVAGVLWLIIGVIAFRRLWNQPDRRH